jgi:hypothetical protein
MLPRVFVLARMGKQLMINVHYPEEATPVGLTAKSGILPALFCLETV